MVKTFLGELQETAVKACANPATNLLYFPLLPWIINTDKIQQLWASLQNRNFCIIFTSSLLSQPLTEEIFERMWQMIMSWWRGHMIHQVQCWRLWADDYSSSESEVLRCWWWSLLSFHTITLLQTLLTPDTLTWDIHINLMTMRQSVRHNALPAPHHHN